MLNKNPWIRNVFVEVCLLLPKMLFKVFDLLFI